MYVVRNSNNEVVLIASRKEDTEGYVSSMLNGVMTVEEVKNEPLVNDKAKRDEIV